MTISCRRFLAFFSAAALLCGPAEAARPKNFRKKRAAAVKKKSAPPPPAPAPREGLAPGRWDPDVRRALEDLAYAQGKDSPGYDAQTPPVAVLPWNDAAVAGDPSEALFFKLVERVDFKYSDDFWQLVPLAYGRQRLRADYEQFSAAPQSVWVKQATYQQYRKNFLKAYQDMCYKLGRKECRVFIASLCLGFEEDELRGYARRVIDAELAAPSEIENVRLSPGDQFPATIRRGLGHIPEIKNLAAFLLKRGFDVWAVSDDNQWVLEVMVKDYGIDSSRALGVKVSLDKTGKLGSAVPEPVPLRGGKVDALVSAIGREPALVVGSESWDLALLSYGGGARLVLDKGDRSLRAAAAERQWLVQPSFFEGAADGSSAAAFEPEDGEPAQSGLKRAADISPPPKISGPDPLP